MVDHGAAWPALPDRSRVLQPATPIACNLATLPPETKEKWRQSPDSSGIPRSHCFPEADLSLSFWRTKTGNEVDLVLYGRAGFWAFEVKHAAAIRAADLKRLKAFREDYPEVTCRLLYRGRESLEIDGIRCLPCEDFLRGLISGQLLL